MPSNRRWTPEEDDTLRRMASQGAFSYEIAAALSGRTYQGVKGRASQLKINMRDNGQLQRINAAKRGKPMRVTEKNIAAMRQGYMNNRALFEDRRRASIRRARCEKLYPGLPQHMWDDVNRIRTSTGMKSYDAYMVKMADWRRQIDGALRQICKVVAQEAKRELTHRRSFAGQLERVQGGARVVPALRFSRLAAGDYSLTGNATALL